MIVLSAAGLAVWLLTRSSGGHPVEPARLSGSVVFVRAGPGVVMVGGETSIAANPRLVVFPLPKGHPRILASGGDIRQPSVSPDGSRVVFAWARVLGAGPPVFSLYTERVDGSQLSRLTICRPPSCTRDTDPSWSPDGTRIAFLRTTGSNQRQRLFLLNVAAARAHPISLPGLSPLSGASWSSEGIGWCSPPTLRALPPWRRSTLSARTGQLFDGSRPALRRALAGMPIRPGHPTESGSLPSKAMEARGPCI